MKSFKIFLALFLLTRTVEAQVISPTIVNSAGLANTLGNIHFEFNLGESFTSTLSNSLFLTQGLLQPLSLQSGPLPVTGLEFTAKRINSATVKLDWKTTQEINNHGFYAERKKENEQSFTNIQFVPSNAINGNSSLPLLYTYSDANNFQGKTYYRLKQVDRDSQYVYSVIRTVNGSGKKPMVLKVWPIPSTGPVQVTFEGFESDQLLVFDNSGRLIKKLPITNQKAIVLQGLAPGTYIIKPATQKDLSQVIIIQ